MATALSTLIHQRHLTPSCGGHAPTAERTVGPARMIVESLTPRPGIREQNRPIRDIAAAGVGTSLRQGWRTVDASGDFVGLVNIAQTSAVKRLNLDVTW